MTLRTGERVTAAVVHAPDLDWAARLEALLEHVWTDAADRGTGGSSLLMERVLADFRGRNGRAIFLGTVFDTVPWHYYRRRGFLPVEPGSGYMAWYRERETFEQSWFRAAATVVEPLRWAHWPATAPLFLMEAGGVARLVASALFGRASSEDPLLPVLRQLGVTRPSGPAALATVLRDGDSPAILGFASRMPDPLWPGTDIIDVFCHPSCWRRAPELLATVRSGAAPRIIAYCDPGQPEKQRALECDGFRVVARLPQWIKPAIATAPRVDISLLVRA